MNGIRTTSFWTALASGIILLIQAVLRLFGIEVSEKNTVDLLNAVNVIITAASIGGILINPEKVDSYVKLKSNNESKG